jgi:hypothetical protein
MLEEQPLPLNFRSAPAIEPASPAPRVISE